MTVSNDSLALALLVDAIAGTARDAGLGVRDSLAADLRRQQMAAEAERQREALRVAAAAKARRAQVVYLAAGALTGLIAGIVINTILNTEQSNGRSFGDESGISAGWRTIIMFVTVGLGLALAAYDWEDAPDFVETVMMGGRWGAAIVAICVLLGVLAHEIRDDNNVLEKIIVVILNGGIGGILGGLAGGLFFGAAAIVYATIRRIAAALTGAR